MSTYDDRGWESDADFINALKRKEDNAWVLLNRRIGPILFNACFIMGINKRADIEDRVQAAFIRAYEKIGSFELRANYSLVRWMIVISNNLVKDWFDTCNTQKRGGGFEFLSLQEAFKEGEDETIEETIGVLDYDSLIDLEAVQKGMLQLMIEHPQPAQVVVLKIYHGYQFEEISKKLSITLPQAKALYYNQALPILKQIFIKMGFKKARYGGVVQKV